MGKELAKFEHSVSVDSKETYTGRRVFVLVVKQTTETIKKPKQKANNTAYIIYNNIGRARARKKAIKKSDCQENKGVQRLVKVFNIIIKRKKLKKKKDF